MLLVDAGLNKKTATALAKKKIYTVNDFLNFKPRKYKDYSKVVTLKNAKVNDYNAIKVSSPAPFIFLYTGIIRGLKFSSNSIKSGVI